MTPAIDACHLLAEHGWALLEAGRLVALGQLAGSSAFLGGGLSLLMGAHRYVWILVFFLGVWFGCTNVVVRSVEEGTQMMHQVL